MISQIELIKIQNFLYDTIDWLTPKLQACERFLSDWWSQMHLYDFRQVELAAL